MCIRAGDSKTQFPIFPYPIVKQCPSAHQPPQNRTPLPGPHCPPSPRSRSPTFPISRCPQLRIRFQPHSPPSVYLSGVERECFQPHSPPSVYLSGMEREYSGNETSSRAETNAPRVIKIAVCMMSFRCVLCRNMHSAGMRWVNKCVI